MTARRWRRSLYARAALFIMLGSGSLVGAVYVLSSKTVDMSVARLLRERIDLARTTGTLVEDRVRGELTRLVSRVRAPLLLADQAKRAAGVRAALLGSYRDSLYKQGVFVLDAKGALVVGVPAAPRRVVASLELGALVRRARSKGVVSSALTTIAGTGAAALVLVAPVRDSKDRVVGFIGGLLEPAATNVLAALARAGRGGRLQLDLVDRHGRTVASSSVRDLLHVSDHNRVLAEAIEKRKPLRGRCHSCHQPSGKGRTTTVLAFAPLPTLRLGVAVRQPERKALAPAFALKRRMLVLGVTFVALFLLFAGLSVHSVVRPIVRLTRAVRAVDHDEGQGLSHFGPDEVGELARAVAGFRQGMLDSLSVARENREALDGEVETTRRQLDALQRIAELTTEGVRTQVIADESLVLLLDVPGVCAAALEISLGELHIHACERLTIAEARELLTLAPDGHDVRRSRYRSSHRPLAPDTLRVCDTSPTTLVAARVVAPQGVEVRCWVAGKGRIDERWLRSLLHQVTTTATARLLRDAERNRERQRGELLQRVLRAQESERQRVAHDLHDTLAQNLAALRLDIERLTARGDGDDARELERLEQRAAGLLDEVRAILLDLRLPPLENMGLISTLGWHLERVQREHGVRGTLAVDGEEHALAYERAAPMFRVVQEALQNVVQHAEASHAFVSVVFGEHEVTLTVEDDGSGFDVDAAASERRDDGHGLGVLGMAERARLLGGTLRIVSAPGEGSTVTLIAPLARPDEAGSQPGASAEA